MPPIFVQSTFDIIKRILQATIKLWFIVNICSKFWNYKWVSLQYSKTLICWQQFVQSKFGIIVGLFWLVEKGFLLRKTTWIEMDFGISKYGGKIIILHYEEVMLFIFTCYIAVWILLSASGVLYDIVLTLPCCLMIFRQLTLSWSLCNYRIFQGYYGFPKCINFQSTVRLHD